MTIRKNHWLKIIILCLKTEQGSLAHGWGMKIIEQIVEKYHGELTIRVDVQVSIKNVVGCAIIGGQISAFCGQIMITIKNKLLLKRTKE